MKISDIIDDLEQLLSDITEFNLDSDDQQKPMIPPLQQKIELMKRSSGLTSAYDDDIMD